MPNVNEGVEVLKCDPRPKKEKKIAPGAQNGGKVKTAFLALCAIMHILSQCSGLYKPYYAILQVSVMICRLDSTLK